MANVDKVIKDLVINEMSQEEFDAQKAAGTIAPNEIYVTPDKTDDKLDKKVSVIQGEENAGKILIVNEDGEVVPDKPKVGASLPILTHVFADHKLNDISWLNADTFSWQSGDVYIAAYEHLVNETSDVRIWIVSASTDRGPYYYRGYIEGAVAPYEWWGGETVYSKTPYPVNGDKLYSSSDGTTVSDGVLETKWGFNNPEEDTIGDITIEYFLAEDGHKICASNQEANIQALYEATGVAWYYILDIANKQFKLPRTKFGFTGLRDSVGNYVPAGLPNITANFNAYSYGSGGGSGAVTSAIGTPNTLAGGSQSSYNFNIFAIDASRSSSTYGASNTVQPRATQMYLYFYVGNFERDALEQTAGITSEQLNNKLDKSAEIYLVPTGTVSAFAGKNPPTGWLKCDGSAVSRTTYAKLFAVIGQIYGGGDGSTTFNLPNLTGRVPFGMDGNYVGQSTNGVLPNILGILGVIDTNNVASGAFYVDGTASGNSSSPFGTHHLFKFNAGRYNPMYGGGWFDGERVVPSSVGMTYYIKY